MVRHQRRACGRLRSLDPIFLQMLMGLTQGTKTADGTVLDGGSTVRVLMHDTYWRNLDDYGATDVYFTEAASGETVTLNEISAGAPIWTWASPHTTCSPL